MSQAGFADWGLTEEDDFDGERGVGREWTHWHDYKNISKLDLTHRTYPKQK